MNDIKQAKEKQINDYISNSLLKEDSIDVDKMKTELSTIIGEKPGIELDYKTEYMIVEDGKESIKKNKLDSINIYYTYEDNGKIYFDSLTYLAD